MLGGFHIAQCVEECIEKFAVGCGLEEGLLESVTFGKKVLDSVLWGKNYGRELRGLLLLQYAIENVKCKAFWEEHNIDDHAASVKNIKTLRDVMVKKGADECKAQYKHCSKTVLKVQQ